MDKKEAIELVLEEYFPQINKYLGKLVEQELELNDYANGLLVSHLLKANLKLPSLEKKGDYLENDYNDEEFYDEDYLDEVYSSKGFKLDSGLYYLNKTLDYGDQNCEGFDYIFKNTSGKKPQELEKLTFAILTQVKAYEFLSKVGFENITKVDRWKNELKVDFVAYKPRKYFILIATQLYSGKYIEEHPYEYDDSSKTRLLTNDISYAVEQKYPQIAKYCQTNIGEHVGILFLSTSRDYFGNKQLENSVYGLNTNKLNTILNKEFVRRQQEGDKYRFLNHLVVTTGRNIRKAVIYPSIKMR